MKCATVIHSAWYEETPISKAHQQQVTKFCLVTRHEAFGCMQIASSFEQRSLELAYII